MMAGVLCRGGILAYGDVLSLDNGEVLTGDIDRFVDGVFIGYFTGSDRTSFKSGEVKRISFSTGRWGTFTTTSGKTDIFQMASFENGQFVWVKNSVETATIQAKQVQRVLFSSQKPVPAATALRLHFPAVEARKEPAPAATASFSHPPAAGEMKEITLPGGATMKMVWCPPGVFFMGSPAGEKDRDSDETQHSVRLTKGFWMAKTEVTQRQWLSVMGNNPSFRKGDDLPVESVSWNDCQRFCAKAGLRLPTEAEWEYACRAGSTGAYGGTGKLGDMGWFSGSSSHPVGQKRENAWKLFDMHGNVYEWCEDRYGDYSGKEVTDPTGAGFGDFRVLRGGSYGSSDFYCRSAHRYKLWPTVWAGDIGFRPVQTEYRN